MVFALLLTGALSNFLLRGGGLEIWFKRNISGMRYVNAVLFGLTSYLLSGDVIFGSAMALAMTIAQMFGINHDKITQDRFVTMLLRGIVWCVILGVTMFLCGYDPILYLFPMFLMFPVYRLSYEYFRSHAGNKYLNRVTVAEIIFGALLWMPLITVL